jgi:hypothetical protein
MTTEQTLAYALGNHERRDDLRQRHSERASAT